MGYRLDKPYTETERAEFIVRHNHQQGLKIEETENAIFALEAWEKLVGDNIYDNTTEYEQEQEKLDRQRLNLLNLTKADVLLALYADKGLTPEDIKEMLKNNVPALIKFDYASSYYRGDEVVNALGSALGYTTEEMDYLFENKKFPEKDDTPVDADSATDNDNPSGDFPEEIGEDIEDEDNTDSISD